MVTFTNLTAHRAWLALALAAFAIEGGLALLLARPRAAPVDPVLGGGGQRAVGFFLLGLETIAVAVLVPALAVAVTGRPPSAGERLKARAARLVRAGALALVPPPHVLAALAGGLAGRTVGLLAATRAAAAFSAVALPSAEGTLYPLSFAVLGAAAARLLLGLGARPALAAVVAGLLLFLLVGAIPILGPFVEGATALRILLLVSPPAALAGSLLGIDLLRTGPLYRLLPQASDVPYAYPDFLLTLLPPLLVALAFAIAAVAAVAARAYYGEAPMPAAPPASVPS